MDFEKKYAQNNSRQVVPGYGLGYIYLISSGKFEKHTDGDAT
jgi:hypothetical protein